MRIDPKGRFLLSKTNVEAHARTVEGLSATGALDVALLQFQCNLPPAVDGNTAASNHFKLEGARQFANVVLSLHEPSPQPKQVRAPALNHEAQ